MTRQSSRIPTLGASIGVDAFERTGGERVRGTGGGPLEKFFEVGKKFSIRTKFPNIGAVSRPNRESLS